MYVYYLIWEGPLNHEFLKKYGNCWSSGRLEYNWSGDVEALPDEYYSSERGECGGFYNMLTTDFNRLKEFLRLFKSETILSSDQILKAFEDNQQYSVRFLIK